MLGQEQLERTSWLAVESFKLGFKKTIRLNTTHAYTGSPETWVETMEIV